MDDLTRLDGRRLRQALRDNLTRLAAEVDAVKRDAGFLAALDAMSRFWRYSPFNQFCILLQRRDASLVAGRRIWESLGRRVQDGERPIGVFAPVRRGAAYTLVSVWDVRQTRGRKVPRLSLDLRGPSRQARRMERAAARLGIEVVTVRGGGDSLARSCGGRIEIEPGLSGRMRLRALAHELAHEILHQEERRRALAAKRPPPRRSHAERETEADATAWVVCAVLGVRAPSPTYIAWQGGDGAGVLRSMGRVQRAAKTILCAMDKEGAPSNAASPDSKR
ncbi:zincin-like metallopeptidase domain-containing protein [Anaeromyxobacter paludicola]|uniref:IrrE N-terminal-like domain-containing protein n=1 Tax=Anaeromyxobacter paludicola TaxID=2918171 RepID=A0ABM7X9S2_9BACT|nr:hypothetical protein [Anaeromyxobacter paludicola]BDG08596.1 hypothetical protein AMPC_17090 [Anaeromyxobacter paludicola]